MHLQPMKRSTTVNIMVQRNQSTSHLLHHPPASKCSARAGALNWAARSLIACGSGAPFHFLWRDVFHMSGDVPHMSERIFNSSHPISVELIRHGPLHLGPGIDGFGERCVHVADVKNNTDGCPM